MPLPQVNEDYTVADIYNLSEGERAELIGGRIYDMAPPGREHQRTLNIINNTIYNYLQSKGGSCEVYPAPFAVFLNADDKTYVEPDISVICDPDKLTDQGCNGAPDWIIEITSPGNAAHDYLRKLNLYENAGVREYWIVDPQARKVLVYFFEAAWAVKHYSFADIVKANIYEDLAIDFAGMELS